MHSFPELSLASWQFKDATPAPQEDEVAPDMPDDDSGDELAAEVVQSQAPIVPYSLADITRDGCFMSEPELEQLLDRLRTKKNLILQGPPGTGKTWLAKRLAFALMLSLIHI